MTEQPLLTPQDREHLMNWHVSLRPRRRAKLDAAVGHDKMPGRAPRFGLVLMWTAVALCLVAALLLGLAGLDRWGGGIVFLLPFVGLAWLGSYLRFGASYTTPDDELLIAYWEAEQRLRSKGR